MAFFGVEIKPGKPFSHQFDRERGRLHISHVTLGMGSATKKCFVQCNVGDKSPILLCSLTPDQNESCLLDLEFEEEDEVVFSVLGPRSVHLTGYYLGNGSCGHGGDGDDTDSYGEDIGETESEEASYHDSEEDEYEDDFIDDDDDDLEMYPSSPKRKSGVVIEEIVDEKPANGTGDRKRLKKKYHVSDSDGDDQWKIVVKGSNGLLLSGSEDEDGLPITSHLKSKSAAKKAEAEEKSDKKRSKKKVEDDSDQAKGSKRKANVVTQDEDNERVIEQPNDSSVPSLEIEHETGEKPKKKKKKQRVKEAKNRGAEGDNKGDAPEDDSQVEVERNGNQDEAIGNGQDEKLSNEKNNDVHQDDTELKKKKKKKKKSKAQDGVNVGNAVEANKDSIVENEEKKAEVKPSQVRTFTNGLAVEELKMGKPDGKKASPGTKVSVHYIGKLKKNGEIFDSNIGRAPFKFRLGVGEVIKGWDVGVNGMRIGDKRRITIPPAMGYGPKGAGGKIPPNAWLVFDVELVDVR